MDRETALYNVTKYAREVLDTCEAEHREPSKTEQTAIDSAFADVEKAAKRGLAQKKLDTVVAGMNLGGKTKKPQGGFLMSLNETDTYDSDGGPKSSPEYAKAFSDYMKTGVVAPALIEVKASGAEGDTVTGSGGGYLVPIGYEAQLVENLAAYAPVAGAVRNFSTDRAVFEMPGRNRGTAVWTAEGGTYAVADNTYTDLRITTHKVTASTVVSEELLLDSAIDVESVWIEDAAIDIAATVNTALTTGNGTGQPYGYITRIPGGQTVTGVAGTATSFPPDDLFKVILKVPPQYRNRPSTAWMMSDTTANLLRTLKDGMGRYLWQDSLAAGDPPTLMGHPVYLNPDMAAPGAGNKSLAFGDWSQYYFVARVAASVQRLNELYANTGQIGFVARMRLGGDLANTSGLAVYAHGSS